MMLTDKGDNRNYVSDFEKIIDSLPWEEIERKIEKYSEKDVYRALDLASKNKLDIEGFGALISNAAKKHIEKMALLSRKKTIERFGKTMHLFIPLYLSNECKNICTYCGFSQDNPIKRKTLTENELLEEIKIIKKYGFDHILLVTGEDNHNVGIDYIENAVKICRKYFSLVSIEVQPLEYEDYKRLVSVGLHSVLIYQETYHKQNYKIYHPKGKKSNFSYRLHAVDRLGKAGVHRIGLGVLLGLENWRVDSFFCAMHLKYLEKKYWKTRYSISFPRLRPYVNREGNWVKPNVNISDSELVQLICAYRLLDQEIELSLSTRESPKLRDNLIKLGITSMSAGSKTNPGGYAHGEKSSLNQFEIDDQRSPHEIFKAITSQGYEAVWKDWDAIIA